MRCWRGVRGLANREHEEMARGAFLPWIVGRVVRCRRRDVGRKRCGTGWPREKSSPAGRRRPRVRRGEELLRPTCGGAGPGFFDN